MRKLLLFFIILLSWNGAVYAMNCVAAKLKSENKTVLLPTNSKLSSGAHLFFLKNTTSRDILIDHKKNNTNPGVSAGWSTVLHPDHWSALVLEPQKKFALSCAAMISGKYLPINCSQNLFVCTPPISNKSLPLVGSYWLIENMPLTLFLKTLATKGIATTSTHRDSKIKLSNAITSPVLVSQLQGYPSYPVTVQKLISLSVALSKMNLTYLYGSSDPKNKGMDCSGTIYYLLKQMNLADVPRQSDEQFSWAEKNGIYYKVKSNHFDSIEFSNIKPGDLLFWSGTYATKRHSPISHVMIYLGKNDKGERLMFGASDGRTYEGKKMWGVSVFDFKLPNNKGKQRFVGYSCIPNLTC